MKNSSIDILYEGLSHKIVGIAFEVHNVLGPGFSEEIYKQAFIHELNLQGILCETEKIIHITYKGKDLGTYRLDLVIENKIILELKATHEIHPLFKQQLLSYLKATHLHLGILINFGSSKVEHVRVLN